jgi:hypothetical protein
MGKDQMLAVPQIADEAANPQLELHNRLPAGSDKPIEATQCLLLVGVTLVPRPAFELTEVEFPESAVRHGSASRNLRRFGRPSQVGSQYGVEFEILKGGSKLRNLMSTQVAQGDVGPSAKLSLLGPGSSTVSDKPQPGHLHHNDS